MYLLQQFERGKLIVDVATASGAVSNWGNANDVTFIVPRAASIAAFLAHVTHRRYHGTF